MFLVSYNAIWTKYHESLQSTPNIEYTLNLKRRQSETNPLTIFRNVAILIIIILLTNSHALFVKHVHEIIQILIIHNIHIIYNIF